MLYSQSPEENQLSLFKLMVEHLIDGKREYKTFVDSVLLESVSYSKDKTDIYSLSSDKIFIILYLSESLKELFMNHKKDSFSKRFYMMVNTALSQEFANA